MRSYNRSDTEPQGGGRTGDWWLSSLFRIRRALHSNSVAARTLGVLALFATAGGAWLVDGHMARRGIVHDGAVHLGTGATVAPCSAARVSDAPGLAEPEAASATCSGWISMARGAGLTEWLGRVPTFLHAQSENSGSDLLRVAAPVRLRVDDGIVQAVKKVQPAVMGIVNYSQVSDFFAERTRLETQGIGTGVLILKDARYGYVVTNNHVVQDAAKVDAVLPSGKHVHAQVLGTDPYTDLAVIRVPVADVHSITPPQFADSDTIQVGEPAIAIGSPMGLDFANSVTAGIVSATRRVMPVQMEQAGQTVVLDYQTVIQTDAAINPGNSGGPLLNIDGRIIGINSSKIAAPSVEGMGFAIPSNQVRHIAEQIIRTGHAEHPALGITGYSLASLPDAYWPDVPVDYGVWVQSVTSEAARAAGVQTNDVIVGIDKHDVRTMADLRTYLFQYRPGEKVTLRVYRGHRLMALHVKLGATPAARAAVVRPFAGAPDPEGNAGDAEDPGPPWW
jgi:serine protease Do